MKGHQTALKRPRLRLKHLLTRALELVAAWPLTRSWAQRSGLRLISFASSATTTDANNTTRRTLPVWSYAAISGHWLLRERCPCCGEVIRAEHQPRVDCHLDEVDADACVPQLAAHLAFAFDSNVDSNAATRS